LQSNRTLRTRDRSALRHFGTVLVGSKCLNISAPVPICPKNISDLSTELDNHVSAVARSCNYYHARVIRHVRHLLTVDIAQRLACSLILSRIDYCNDVLHGASSGTIQKLQRVQNNAARVVLVLRAPQRSHANSLLQKLHWLPVEQRITYKLAVLTHKTRQTSVPKYLSRHITTRSSTRSLRSSSAPLLRVKDLLAAAVRRRQ